MRSNCACHWKDDAQNKLTTIDICVSSAREKEKSFPHAFNAAAAAVLFPNRQQKAGARTEEKIASGGRKCSIALSMK